MSLVAAKQLQDLKIGFIGTGAIGEPMVERLLAANRDVSIYARREEVSARLANAGAIPRSSPRDLADSDVVIACMFDDKQLVEACTPIIESMSPGSIFASHTTGSPVTIRRLAGIAEARGVQVVEAPFSGAARVVRDGGLTVMLGGEDGPVSLVADVVDAYAQRVLRTGKLGTALPVKLLNNVLFAACTQVTLSAIQIAGELGVAEEDLLTALAVSSGGSAAAEHIAKSGKGAVAYSQGLPRYLAKDVEAAKRVSAELGIDIASLLTATSLGPMDLRLS
jgi:3-hydroxyisobutyrate dehydrogenase-like beta-hydroxyacid dehydrogenase